MKNYVQLSKLRETRETKKRKTVKYMDKRKNKRKGKGKVQHILCEQYCWSMKS